MEKIEHLEQIEPNSITAKLTELILEQNAMILKMNARLLCVISSAQFFVTSDEGNIES